MKNACRMSILMLFMSLAATGILFAQSDLGTISGFIKDQSGASIPNAKVTIKNQTGIERQTTTNDSGYYSVTNIPPGLYTMSAEAPSFQKYESTNNKLDPDGHLGLDATLTLGAATQTVEVMASAVTLQTESAAVQKLVTREQIDSLEINGRNPIFMANLVPGTRGGTLANLSFNFSQGPSNINGSRNPENLITYDGAPATRTRSNGTSLGSADVDSTQEVQILTADYAPEYGRTSGGQIRIITKSGGQQFHGAAYEYVRNTVLNANTWQRNANSCPSGSTTCVPTAFITPPTHYNQFGYNLGGPFYIPNHFNTDKSKVFWYWGEEWVRFVFTDSRSLTVPTLKMRQGDFSELLVQNNIFYKNPVFIKDPQQTGNCNSTDQIACFFDPSRATPSNPQGLNIIPMSRVSQNGLGILNVYPAPNLTTPINGNQNWLFFAKHPQNQRKDTIAVDVNLTNQQRLRFRRMYYTFWEYQPLDGDSGETPKFFDRPNQTNSIDHVWTISPRKVNELLLTASLDVVHIPVNATGFLDRTKGAVQGTGFFGTNYAYIFPAKEKLLPNRIPTVNMANFSTLSGGPYPSHSSGPIYDVSDSFTWVKGNHTLKFGGLFEHAGENDNDEINVQACLTCTNNQNGQFSFTDGRAGGTSVAAANTALGLFDTYSEIGHRAFTVFRANMWEGFSQDSWSATRKLHIDYGVRYTVIVPYHALWGNMIVFDPRFYDPSKAVTVDPTTGLIVGTVDPKTGLVVGTGQDTYNGMVIPGGGFPGSATGRVPEADPSQFDFSRLFRGVPDHYSDIQWGGIQPRLGIAYQLTPKTVLRAGAGRFFTRLGVSDSIFLGGDPPFQPNASLSNSSVDALGPSAGSATPLVVTTQSKAFKNPEAWAWNFTFEREMPWKSNLSLAYVARRGLHLQREADINQPTTAVAAAHPCLAASPPCKVDAFRPYEGFGSIRQTDNVASSMYNSFQLAWNRRFSGGLLFGVAYTLSKSMDNGSNQRDVVPDTYDVSMLWGPSEFDARHILAINYLYQIPFFRKQSGFAGKAFGGWQISGVSQFQTGTPCSVAEQRNIALVGLDSNFGCGVNGQYWVKFGDPRILGNFGANGWFQTCLVNALPCPDGTAKFNGDDERVFRPPTAGTFNTQRVRDLIYQPGFENWNLGLFKSFPITESRGLQFRAEAYNVWNHPNLGGSSGGGVQFNPKSSTFGKVTSKGSERNLQLSLRFYF